MKTRTFEEYRSAVAQTHEIKLGIVSEMRDYYLKGVPSTQLAKYYNINIHTFYQWLKPTPEERGIHSQNLTKFNLPVNSDKTLPTGTSIIEEMKIDTGGGEPKV